MTSSSSLCPSSSPSSSPSISNQAGHQGGERLERTKVTWKRGKREAMCCYSPITAAGSSPSPAAPFVPKGSVAPILSRHVFPCVSSSLAHIASQPPFVILFPRGDPSEMPGALGGWSDLPFVLCFVFSLLLLLCFVVLVCLSCYRQVRLRSGRRYLVSGPLSKSLEISGRK